MDRVTEDQIKIEHSEEILATANPDWRYIPDTAEKCYLCGKRADYHNNGWFDRPGADFHLCKKHLDRHHSALLGYTDAAQLKVVLDNLKTTASAPAPPRLGSACCPKCDAAIYIEQDTKPDGRIVCPYCKARFAGYETLIAAIAAKYPTPPPPLLAQRLPVDRVDPNPHQPRQDFDEAKLKELAASIKEHGLIQPIVVHANPPLSSGERGLGGEVRYTLHAGERRLRASKLAGLTDIPAYIVPPGGSAQSLLIRAVVENVQRADMNPLELAKAYQDMADMGMSDAEIAAQVAKSRSSVANTRRLLQLPDEQQAQVASGQLNERQALALLPLYQLPPEVRQQVTDTYDGRKLLDPHNLTSDQIRAGLRGAIRQKGQAIAHIDPDFVFSGDAIHHPTCTGCDLYLKIGDDQLCLGRACLTAKQNQAITTYLEQAQAATGLAYLDPALELNWKQVDNLGDEPLQVALEKKCPHLRLQFRLKSWDYGPGPEAFTGCRYQCFHNGQGCACAGRLTAEKEAQKKERQEAFKKLTHEARDHLVQIITANHPNLLRVILNTMLNNYYGDNDMTAKLKPGQIVQKLAEQLVERNVRPNEYRTLAEKQAQIDAWLTKMGLPPLEDPIAAKLSGLERRLARIEAWLTDHPERPPVEQIQAIRGNLTNLAEIAEELAPLDAPELTARLDAAKRTLLTWLDQVENQLPSPAGRGAGPQDTRLPGAQSEGYGRAKKDLGEPGNLQLEFCWKCGDDQVRYYHRLPGQQCSGNICQSCSHVYVGMDFHDKRPSPKPEKLSIPQEAAA